MLKKMFKNLAEPFYRRFTNRLVVDLQVNEYQRLLHHLIGQMDKLQTQQFQLTKEVQASHLILSGVFDLNQNQESNLHTQSAIYDLFAIFQSQPPTALSVFNYLNKITQVNLKNKSVCFVGGNDPYYTQQAKKQGASSVIRIEMNPRAFWEKETINEFSSEKVLFVYPTKIPMINLPSVDYLFIPDYSMGSFMIKYHLFNLGAKVKQNVFITVMVSSVSISSDKKEPPFIFDENQAITIYNDSYIRKQLHKAGFSEVTCIYSQGKNIDNPTFDKKITHLSYQDDSRIVRNHQPLHKKKHTINHISLKTYCARKLPSLDFIKKPHEA